jgi:hypothetical protein
MPPEPPPPTEMPNLEQIADLLGNFEMLWTYANEDERQAIFHALFTNLYVGNGTIVAAEPTAVMWQLLNYGTIESASDSSSPKITRTGPGTGQPLHLPRR